jgi:hypothetical protein
MRRVFHLAFLLALFGAAAPALAQDAQRALERSGFKVVSAPAGTRVMTATQAQQAGLINPGASVGAGTGAGDGATVRTLLEGNYPVPGLGFDYVHHAAVNRNLDKMALIDPLTQQRLALARQIRRETPAVPVLPFFPMMPQVIVVQSPPPVIVLQQAAPESAEAPSMRAARLSTAPAEPETAAEAPVAQPVEPHRELEEYVLVRKDGREIYLVAFSTHNGRVVYITREGLRRSVALSDLDAAATSLRNDERGAAVKLPI